MKNTYLIQRLKKPTGYQLNAFGGGLKNGGLSDETADLVSKLWSFDYMGAAQFEYEAVPKALQRIIDYFETKRAVTNTFDVQKGKEIHYICEQGTEGEIEKRIKQLYDDESVIHLKERCYLKESLDGNDEIMGWLELDNAYMFFTNNDMYQATLCFVQTQIKFKKPRRNFLSCFINAKAYRKKTK